MSNVRIFFFFYYYNKDRLLDLLHCIEITGVNSYQNFFISGDWGLRRPLCTYWLKWARRTSWRWWDDTVHSCDRFRLAVLEISHSIHASVSYQMNTYYMYFRCMWDVDRFDIGQSNKNVVTVYKWVNTEIGIWDVHQMDLGRWLFTLK